MADRHWLDLPSMFAGFLSDANAITRAKSDSVVLDILKEITPKELNGTVTFAENVIGYMKRLENNLKWSNIMVRISIIKNYYY